MAKSMIKACGLVLAMPTFGVGFAAGFAWFAATTALLMKRSMGLLVVAAALVGGSVLVWRGLTAAGGVNRWEVLFGGWLAAQGLSFLAGTRFGKRVAVDAQVLRPSAS